MQQRERLALWLVAIFFLALVARIYLEKYTYIFGFDSYWFARMVSYIIRDGHLPPYDPIAFRGFDPVPTQWELSMEFPAWVYRALYGATYDKMKLLTVFKWLPAIFGAFGSMIAALIGVVVAGPLAGILTGVFAATNPGYVYRTMGSFYEDDATSFILVLAVLFSMVAYGARKREHFLGWLALAAVTALLAAISWQGFYILPYTAVVFALLWVGYHIAVFLSRYFSTEFVRKYEFYLVLIAGAVAAVLAGAIVKALALKEAADALYLTGALSMTTVYTLALSYVSIAFWGAFAASAVLGIRRGDPKYGYMALGLAALAVLTVLSAANRTYVLEITLPDGTDATRPYNLGSFGAALLGSALMILVAQLAGVLAAYLFPDRNAHAVSPDWKILAVVFVPLLFAALSCPINGYCWFSNALSVIYKIVFPPESVSQSTDTVIVQPYTGFIEPLTGGPWSRIIGEETTGFLNWPAKYGILFVIVLFSIPFLGAKIREDRRYLFLLAWVALTWWAAWYKLKYAYYFGVPIAIASAVLLADLWESSKRWGRWSRAIMAVLIVFVSVSMAATGVFHTVSKVPTLITSQEATEMYMFGGKPADGYIELFQWLEANTPPDANLLNWWSIGHWLTFFTERGVMTDNTNARLEADYEAARFFLFDENTSYEIARKRGMNYAIVESSLLWGAPSLAIYAYETENLADPRVRDYGAAVLYCYQSSSPVYRDKYLCFSNQGQLVTAVDKNIYESIPSFEPGSYQPSETAFKILLGDKNYVAYRGGKTTVGGKVMDVLLILTEKLNDSTLVKMLLHAPLEHFEFQWVSSDGQVMVYKIE